MLARYLTIEARKFWHRERLNSFQRVKWPVAAYRLGQLVTVNPVMLRYIYTCLFFTRSTVNTVTNNNYWITHVKLYTGTQGL